MMIENLRTQLQELAKKTAVETCGKSAPICLYEPPVPEAVQRFSKQHTNDGNEEMQG